MYRIVSPSRCRSGMALSYKSMPHAQPWEGTVCSQLFEAHASTDGDAVRYPFRKGNTPVLKTLKELHFPGLFYVLGAEGVSHADLDHGCLGAVLHSTHRTDNFQAAP